jgi:Ca2+-binding RTX toxin-like protein
LAILVTVLPGTAFSVGKSARTVSLSGHDDVYHANKEERGAQTIRGMGGDDRIWGGVGHDVTYGGPGDDRLHNFQAASGEIYGGRGHDICVVGVKPGGKVNVEVHGCDVIKYRQSQGHG